MTMRALLLIPIFSLAAVLATPGHAAEKRLSQDDLKSVLPGSSGQHWSLDYEEWFVFNWQPGGKLVVTRPDAKDDEEPVQTGKWRVKEIMPKEGDDPEMIRRNNAALVGLYCQKFDNWGGGSEICYDLYQVSFNKVQGSEELAKTQEYKCYREAGAETGEFIITRK